MALLITLSLFLTSHDAGAEGSRQHLLILHSYSPDHPWTERINAGILSHLRTSSSAAVVHVEFMDSKNYPPAENFSYLQKFYAKKYAKDHFAAILLSDNNALDFMLKYGDKLFPGVSLVFCGINDFDRQMFKHYPQMTGITEELDIRRTIELSKTLIPNLKHFYAVIDDTPTGRLLQSQLAQVI